MATPRSSGYVVTHTVWNAVLSSLTDDGLTFSGNFNGGSVAGTTAAFSSTLAVTGAATFGNGISLTANTSANSLVSRGRSADNISQIPFTSNDAASTYGYVRGSASGLQLLDSAGTARVTVTTAGTTTAGPVLAADGSAAAPSLSFAADPDAGFHRTTYGVGLATGGVTRAEFGSTGVDAGYWSSFKCGTDGGAAGATVTIEAHGTSGTAPGVLALVNKNLTPYYLWVDSTGDLRIGATYPNVVNTDTTGTVVGTQS